MKIQINKKSTIYFVGIGGIGMSALARYFHATHKSVSGYDKTPSDNTKALEKIGIKVSFRDDIQDIDSRFLDNTTTLVVYTPAVPKTNSILARTAKVMAVVISAKQLALNSLDFIISKYLVYITTIYKYY